LLSLVLGWHATCNHNRMRPNRCLPAITLFVLSLGIVSIPFNTSLSYAQSSTSGDIAGTVTDSTGAAIPGAKIIVKSLDSGVAQTLTANGAGIYRASLLRPGKYSVSVTAAGFQTTATEVNVQVGQIAPADLKLGVGSSATVVDVTSEAQLLHTENADISTTFSAQAVQSLPNPGNDLTFVAQTSPGAVMNTSTPSNGTAFGYGNFSVFGLPATSNTFTLNGTYENDPFLNLSSSGATNLLLGNNEVSEVNVVSNAYGAQYGGLGGAQVNEITQSGTNKFHGNAVYQWNGRILNANDYFRNQTPTATPRPFDNVNQYAASFGGPIIKDKLFFFVNYEGLRVVIPTSGQAFAPTQAYIASTLANAQANDPGAVPLYQNLFSVYTNSKGYSTAAPSQSDPNAVAYTYSAGNFTHEFLLTSRVDWVLGNKDTAFGHFKWDKGVQATYTDPLNPIFNADSIQPSFEGTFGETHVFNPNVTNQFLFSVLWYSAVFTNQQLAASTALVPESVFFDQVGGGTFTGVGGINYVWPQGRNVTNYQFIDDFSVIRGHHALKAGVYYRRDDVTDYSPGVTTTPLAFADENGAFANGLGFDFYSQQYPTRNTQPVAVYNLAGYVQDTWKVQPNFNLTAAIRFEHNSNPVCQTNCFAYTNGPFASLNPDTATAYNTLLKSDQHVAFPSFQPISVNPRIGFAFSPRGAEAGTVVRGGFGLFTDVFPGTIADDFLNNAPSNVGFTIFGPDFGGAAPFSLNPASAASGQQITAGSNAAFQSGFRSGASNNTLSANVPGFSSPNIATADGKLFYPTYEEYSLELEQALDRSHHTTLAIRYVGNHGYHEPVVNNGVNAGGVNNGALGFDGVTPINFTGFPDAPPNPNFAQATVVGNGAGSNYNGVSIGVVRQTKSLTLQFNYGYSHALDEISNGGILGFGAATSVLAPVNPANIHQNYGNADYDVRQNLTAAYVYSMPYFGGPHLLTDNWQVSGTVFHHTGFPFTVVDSAVTAANYGGTAVTMFAQQVNGVKSCGGGAVFNNVSGTTPNPCAIAAPGNYIDPTGFGQQARNQTYGPAYTDSDFAIQKGFRLPIPHLDAGKINVGAQFFNLFNHPNFASPGHDINNPSTLGSITSTVNTPTSILGSGLGGDASPRLIQLKGSIVF
jgi:hypothetical protein